MRKLNDMDNIIFANDVYSENNIKYNIIVDCGDLKLLKWLRGTFHC